MRVLAVTLGLLTAAAAPGTDGPRRLTEHAAEDRAPSWSPSGDRLLFTSDRDGDFEIYSIRLDGTGLERLTQDPAADRSPAWSPDGTRFVFESDRGGSNGLWIQRLEDGAAELLLADPSPELVPDWSPDGEWIAFTSERSGNPGIYRLSLHDRSLERLTDDPHRNLWPRYSPSGDRLVFFSRRATEGRFDDLFVLDLGSRAVTQITAHPTHHDFVPDFAADGRRIVAGMSDREAGRRALVIHDPADSGERLFIGRYHRVFHPAWSPDGRWIAYAARAAEGERADIFVEAAGAALLD